METNKISLELLAQGWTKNQTPEGFRPWNDFYGGWEYKQSTYRKFTFITPCGLLVKGEKVTSNMSYMGVEWMAENDNPVINCPFYSLRECPMRHPLLAGKTIYNYISRTSDSTEFNLYSETEHFHIWLRFITREKDYNLYCHYYLK